MEKTLVEGKENKRLNGFLRFRKHHNKGAFLNAGQKRQPVVAILSVLLTVGVAAVFVLSLGQQGNRLMKTGLSLLLGGAFCNTYDRLKRKYVVDYVSFGVRWKWLSRIVFNLSDFGRNELEIVQYLGKNKAQCNKGGEAKRWKIYLVCWKDIRKLFRRYWENG